MMLPTLLFTLKTLIRDTLAQARAAGITWGLLAVTVVCTLFCFSTSVSGDTEVMPTRPYEDAVFLPKSEVDRMKMTPEEARSHGVDVAGGELRFLWGAIAVPIQRERGQVIRFVQFMLAGGVADTAGILLCLLWTASFLPGFLDPASASVLFAKPLPRSTMLVGKFVGVVVAVALQAVLFVAATWLALGIRTGVWNLSYFAAIPLLVTHFAAFFAISAAIAVMTRSTVACALGTLAVWFVCFGINLARHDAVVTRDAAPLALEAAYWITPKPLDINLMLAQSMDATNFFRQAIDVRGLEEKRGFQPEFALLSSALLPIAAIMIAGRRLTRTDY